MRHLWKTILKPYLHACLILALLLPSCASYKQNIMFKVPEDYVGREVMKAEKNYVVQVNDLLLVDVYTNEGERIIDPDFKLTQEINAQSRGVRPEVSYLVDLQGVVKLPMVGEIKVAGLTIREVEAMLQDAYEKFYARPFVVAKYLNKRVIVLGAPGGKVIPLTSENMRLVEVLALAEGLDATAKSHNIRVLRNEEAFLIDFSTVDGYRRGNMIMEPGDVVYVEPVRKPVSEAVRDYGPLVSLVVSLITLIIVINN